jgi:beta-glucanase (GH16 family)
MESRGNRAYPHGNTSEVMSTLHWGPNYYLNKYFLTTDHVMTQPGQTWADDFHTYGLEWTEEGIRTYVDGTTILQVDFDKTAWNRGQFSKSTMNPWEGGDISAPFDQEFYLVCTT